MLATPANIQTSAIAFYQDLLSTPSWPMDPIHPDIIPSLFIEDDNMTLNRSPHIHEVQEIVFSMDAGNIVDPDGFSTLSFQHC